MNRELDKNDRITGAEAEAGCGRTPAEAPENNGTDAGSPLHGGDVYRNRVRLDFSVNLNPMPMPAGVFEAAEAGLKELRQYPDPLQQKLRESIASLEGTAAENIICGNGASELLMAVCHAFRPRRALITAPCYSGYSRALRAAGAEIMEYMTDESSGFAVDEGILDAMEYCFRDGSEGDGCCRGIVFIADPNNPDGRLIDAGLKKRIISKCAEMGVAAVIDECFLPLTERGVRESRRGANKEKESAAADGELIGAEAADSALHLRAFTKTLAVPGIRIGYMISGDSGKLFLISEQLPEWNVSRIAERTGEAAAETLRDTDYLERSVRMIAEEREYLYNELKAMGLRVYHSDVNYLLFRADPGLYDRLLSRGILIRRCADFSGLDDSYFRIAVRTHADNTELIAALREAL